MSFLIGNPELVRNARAELRPGRLLAATAICAALSLAIGYSMAHIHSPAENFLKLVLFAQVFALTIGGGTACIHAIQREKDQNTFDYQRVTRLTPLELTLGKLFGSPALAWFVVLCLVPAGVYAAVVSRIRPSFFVAAYALLVLGSICFHAFALLLSLLVKRGGATAAVLLLLLLLGATSGDSAQQGAFYLRSVSPFYAAKLVQGSWDISEETRYLLNSPATRWDLVSDWGMADVFFGRGVHHFFVLLVLYTTFAAWFVLAVVRNVKRDPAVYALYSPWQALGLAFYVNLIFLGFFHWKGWTPLDAQAFLTTLNIIVFFLLGLVLLRNRDCWRRILCERGRGWLSATWPATILLPGSLLVGLAIVWMNERNLGLGTGRKLGIFRAAFFAAWLLRDVLYLQWMSLRRTRRALVLAVLYLIVYYTCATVLFGALGFFAQAEQAPYIAILVPLPVFALDAKVWVAHPAWWVFALVMQIFAAGLFATFQSQKLRELAPAAGVPTLATGR